MAGRLSSPTGLGDQHEGTVISGSALDATAATYRGRQEEIL